ncbi:MAG: rhamnogalacturonan acetylesterase [Planctomycetales bacterium]|nr:rhamnogalacturonan acetylesterase [Planctomycetales bacterium]
MCRPSLIFLCILLCQRPSLHANSWRFSFAGDQTDDQGTVVVSPDDMYLEMRGYGFEPGADVRLEESGRACVSDKPFRFSMRLDEGNYRVTVRLRGTQSDGEGCQTIRAENRRLMVERLHCECGVTVQASFAVNVRTPHISEDESVGLNAREYDSFQWDDRLTLEFNGNRPCVEWLEVVPAENTTTVFLAGDSTVTDQSKEPWCGWGQILPRLFKPSVVIANHAESGRSLRSFRNEGRWAKILSTMKPNDVVLIQFGHNDMKEKGQGVGPYQSYSELLREYVKEVRALQGHPILVTPMHRRWFSGDKIRNTHGDYPDAMRQVANELDVPLIDLHEMSAVMYNALGPSGSKSAFVHYPANTFPNQTERLKDDSHHNTYGAYSLALCVVKGIKDLKLDLAEELVDKLPDFDPANPVVPHVHDIPQSPFPVAFTTPEGS